MLSTKYLHLRNDHITHLLFTIYCMHSMHINVSEANMIRSVVHMDLDTFFVSCERLIDSRLNGKPVLIGGTSDRGVVASCSYEARKFGIHSAMPMRMAKQLCPEAVILRGNSGTYTKFSKDVTDVIKESVPLRLNSKMADIPWCQDNLTLSIFI